MNGTVFRGVLGISTLLVPGLGQTPTQRATFEVASIRPTKDVTASPSIGPSPGGERFMARNMPVVWLVATAYHTSIYQISGLPDSLRAKDYDIEAKSAHPATRTQMMEMLQSLLEDRFSLRLRRETKDLNVYVLAVAKGGPKLNQNRDGAQLQVRRLAAGKTSYTNIPMPLFANILSDILGETVVDESGLDESFDFVLEFTPDRVGQGVRDGRELGPSPDGPSLFTALQEQLGLKLERRKAPIEVLVVEHIEELSGN